MRRSLKAAAGVAGLSVAAAAVGGIPQNFYLRYVVYGDRIGIFQIKGKNFLRLIVLEDGKVFPFQIADEIPIFVTNSDIHQDNFSLRAKHVVICAGTVPASSVAHSTAARNFCSPLFRS